MWSYDTSLSVDDIIIVSNDAVFIAALKKHLQQRFEMKNLGPLSYFLGLEFVYTSRGYLVS